MDMLPVEFVALQGKVNFIQKINENEFHSSCPQCGGGLHADGSYPDRFIMWRSSRRGTPFAMCVRKCGYRWTPEKADAHWTPEERAEFERKARELEEEWNKKETERLNTLAELVRSQQIYQRCYEASINNRESVEWWEQRGIGVDWQEYFGVGMLEGYTVRNHLTTYKSRAYTIPLWTLGDRIENITLRVAHPMDSNDRYRRLYRSKAQHLYYPLNTLPPTKKVVLMEGEIKGMVAAAYSHLDPSQYTILSVQSKAPERRILKMLDFAEVVYLAFDPDAYIPESTNKRVAVLEVAKQLGMNRTRFVIPPNMKFDDAILQGFQFRNAINMAVKSL